MSRRSIVCSSHISTTPPWLGNPDAMLMGAVMQRRRGFTRTLFVLLVMLASTWRSAAEVAVKGPTGFVVQQRVDVAVSPERAYDAFTRIGDWWSGAHSFSGDAK